MESWIIQNKTDFLKKVICFLCSFLIHTGGFYYLLNAKFTHKIIFYKKNVTEAFLVPKEKLYYLKRGENSADRGNLEAWGPSGYPPEGFPSSGELHMQRERIQESGARTQPTPERRPGPQVQSGGEKDEGSSRFSLKFPQDSLFELSKSREKREGKSQDSQRSGPDKKTNFSKYIYPGYSFRDSSSGTYFTRGGGSSGKYTPGRPSQRARAYVKAKGYNLSSWAEEVLNRIQRNWFIPLEVAVFLKGDVGISVTIKKNGEMSSAEIVASSREKTLDESALRALQASGPFPGLPDDFPDENLEVYFVFEYGS
ncbi:MAG: energy transducer TonB [Candidatus Aminicenantales bacterium]